LRGNALPATVCVADQDAKRAGAAFRREAPQLSDRQNEQGEASNDERSAACAQENNTGGNPMSASRREFLKASLGAATLVSFTPTVPSFLARSAMAAAGRRDARDTVLVVVQLSGGNDGLNTLVPYNDPTYAKSRPTLRLPPDEVHKIDAELGFHPKMEGFLRLYKEGLLSVVQGVCYPKNNRDHNGAMRDWHTARPGEATCQTGWLGRTIDALARPDEANTPGVFVGPIVQPLALNAEKAIVPSVRSLGQWQLHPMPGPGGHADRKRLAEAAKLPREEDASPLLQYVRRSTLAAHAVSQNVETVAEAAASAQAAGYPSFTLARTFHTVAELIRADVGIRVYFTELGGGGIGGFDNHANQLGNHCALLHEISESVAALVDDLRRSGLVDRVLLMTFSEFGRTVAENGRRGTGHGAAAPMFLAGGKLKSGLTGAHPSLTDLDQGALKFHTDFRRVYATVLDRWLGLDSRAVLDGPFEPLDVLRV
jgi:uncharacterized protein (DUF1501 family)